MPDELMYAERAVEAVIALAVWAAHNGGIEWGDRRWEK